MIYAKHHIRYHGKMYKPGEVLPEGMADNEWKRLQRLGAVDTVHDPVAAVLTEDEEETPPPEIKQDDPPEGEAAEKTEKPAKSGGDDTVKKPDAKKAAGKAAGGKAASGKAAGGKKAAEIPSKDEDQEDLNAIAGANTVVE